jgi:hypothetical protein
MRKVQVEMPENLMRDFLETLKPGIFDLTDPQREMMSIAFHNFITGIYGSEPKESMHVEVGDYVDINLGWDKVGRIRNELRAGKVIKKHSVEEGYPIAYDLEFTTALEDGKRKTTRIHNVSTAFCVKRTKEYLAEQSKEDRDMIHRDDLSAFIWYTFRKEVSHADVENWLENKNSIPDSDGGL